MSTLKARSSVGSNVSLYDTCLPIQSRITALPNEALREVFATPISFWIDVAVLDFIIVREVVRIHLQMIFEWCWLLPIATAASSIFLTIMSLAGLIVIGGNVASLVARFTDLISWSYGLILAISRLLVAGRAILLCLALLFRRHGQEQTLGCLFVAFCRLFAHRLQNCTQCRLVGIANSYMKGFS